MRAVDALVGPPAAIRRALLHRKTFGGRTRRDVEFGGAHAGAGQSGHCEESDHQSKMPYVALRHGLSDAAVCYRHSTLVISYALAPPGAITSTVVPFFLPISARAS